MGGALLDKWCRGDEAFTIVDPYLAQAPAGVTLVKQRSDLAGKRFDVIVVAIKPQMIDSVLPEYEGMFAPSGFLLSIAAGCSIERLKNAVGGRSVIRVMPNLPAAIGAGVSGLCSSADAEPGQIAFARDIMQRAGVVIEVEDEDALDRVTAVAGSGPGYVFEIARCYVEAAMELGFTPEQANSMVLGTLQGTIAMAQQSDLSLEELRNSVTSKNGTTEAGLNALNGQGQLSTLMSKTLQAAYRRAVELR